jgi:hypothetical protein
MVDKVIPFIKAYTLQTSEFLIGPLALSFFIILLVGFIGYLIMKKSIYGAVLFQLVAMMFILAAFPFFITLFIGG